MKNSISFVPEWHWPARIKDKMFLGLIFFFNLLVSDGICGAHRKLSCWVQGGFFFLNETFETVLQLMYMCLFNAYRCALF